jgi:hydroxymethylglutaryl-CoA lyase
MEIKIHEVGLRDGLQMESKIVPTEIKFEWIKKLAFSGIDFLQIGSFVNPKRMPQMADTDELFRLINNDTELKSKMVFSGLVLNDKGFDRAVDCNVDLICMGVSASETHSMKNTGMSTDSALGEILKLCKTALKTGLKIQASVQSAFGCGFEGKIDEEKVFEIVKKYIDNGVFNISLADTAGYANPEQVKRMFDKILDYNSDLNLTCHFHNTFGLGLVNCYAAMKSGVKVFETAFGGLGGCPFTKLAAGNVCTEDFVHFLNQIEIRKDIKIDNIIELTRTSSSFLEKELPGFVYKSGKIKK